MSLTVDQFTTDGPDLGRDHGFSAFVETRSNMDAKRVGYRVFISDPFDLEDPGSIDPVLQASLQDDLDRCVRQMTQAAREAGWNVVDFSQV